MPITNKEVVALTPEYARSSTTFTEYRKRTLTPISDITFPPGTIYQTPEGLRAEDEETRAAFDVQGGIYPIRESVFQATYEAVSTVHAILPAALAVVLRSVVSREACFNPNWPEGWAERSAAAILVALSPTRDTPEAAMAAALHVWRYGPFIDETTHGAIVDCDCHADAARLKETSIIADGQRWRDAEAEGHIVEFTRHSYGLQHPPSCRPNLTGCAYHLWLADDDLMPPGRYRMTFVSPKGYDEAEYTLL